MNIYTIPEGVTRFPLTVGLIHRGQLRRALRRAGIRFEEDKGLLDSQFVIIEPTDLQLAALINWVERVNAA